MVRTAAEGGSFLTKKAAGHRRSDGRDLAT
jgi:hypothetical protein